MFNFLLRGLFLVLLIIVYSLVSVLGRIVIRSQVGRRRFHAGVVSFLSGVFLRLIRTRISVKNLPTDQQHYLLVSNHLGFLDILVYSSIRPTLFITSVDMRETFGLGFLAEMGGSLFVERRNRNGITKEVAEIRRALSQGFNVMLFPEATSTDGERVLPFKKTLMTAAAGTVPILPVVINYRKVNGEPMSHRYRDYVFWYGDLSFGTAILNILSSKSIDVEVEFFEPLAIHNEDERRQVAERSHELISGKYHSIAYPAANKAAETAPA